MWGISDTAPLRDTGLTVRDYGSAAEMRAAYVARLRRLPQPLPPAPKPLLLTAPRVTPLLVPLPLPDNLPSGKISIPRIVTAVARAHGVTVDDIMGRSRLKQIVAARYHAIALVTQRRGLSSCAVGRRFCRDHSTVLHACRTWARKAPQYAVQIAEAELMLDGAQ